MCLAAMGFIHVAVAVLSLVSVGKSAPVTTCENLIQHTEIQGTDQLLGKWMFIAESTTIPGSKLLTKMFVDSAWAKITADNETDAVSVFQTQKMFGSCYTLTSTMTLANNTLSMGKPLASTAVRLNTGCPDCLVIYSNYTIGGSTYGGLQLLSRRIVLTAAELEEFKKQVECLELPAAAILNPGKGFCPDDSQETGAFDLTSVLSDMNPEILNILDRLLGSEEGMRRLFAMISSGLTDLKGN